MPVFQYILYFQDMFSFTINPNTLGTVGLTLRVCSIICHCVVLGSWSGSCWWPGLHVGHLQPQHGDRPLWHLVVTGGSAELEEVSVRVKLLLIFVYNRHLRMLELWSNFIKFGNPTPAELESEALEGVEWKPVTQQSHQYLRHRKPTFYLHFSRSCCLYI